MRVRLVRPRTPAESFYHVSNAMYAGDVGRTGYAKGAVVEWMKAYTGRRYVLLTNSGTMALQAAYAKYPPATVPNVTFAATLNARLSDQHFGHPLIVSDTDPWATGCPGFCVPTYGLLSKMDQTAFLWDAAQAFGADAFPGGPDLTFSFFANKAATSGEGGAFCTDAQDRYEAARAFVDHGRVSPGYLHHQVGLNGHLANLNAALLLGQLERFREVQDDRKAYCEKLRSALVPGTDTWHFWPGKPGDFLWMAAVCFQTDEDRVAAQGRLATAGIEARASFPPLSEQPAFRDYPVHGPIPTGKILLLPTWYGILQTHPNLPSEIAACL